MEGELKKTLKAVTLELRHLLEGRYDSDGKWKPGDLEQRLAAIGVRRDRESVPVDELGHLADQDRQARRVVDAYLKLREEAGVERCEAVADFVRETAYTWANRLLALRCMEARELIDSVILQQEAYGGRSLEHHRLAQRQPELCAGPDDGLFAVLDKVFREQAQRLPMLFDPQAPGITLRPSPAVLKDCFGLLSLNPVVLRKHRIRIKEDENAAADGQRPNPFVAPDALGWAYQYWNTEEKDRVFERVRTVKGAKIAGADIISATQLYTEDYMVKFLVQNSLGATWMGMQPDSKLPLPLGEGRGEGAGWDYYVKDADRAPVERKPVCEITFLDPACGSGHFLLEAFDLFYAMYQEEGELSEPGEICDAILTKNLFGIDIDPRAVQIAEVALWMKAAERAFEYNGVPTNLVAATASHLKGPAWEEFLAGFEREPSVARVLCKFAQTMEHIDEIGSLARPAEDLREIIREEHATWERQVRERKEANFLFPEIRAETLSGQLPFREITDDDFGDRLFYRARAGIDAFTERARESGDFDDQLLAGETRTGFRLVDLLSRRYDVVAANPPYMGSKNMGSTLKSYVDRNFKAGKRDVSAAFILRNFELSRAGGRVAMVTQQSWMFLRSYVQMRVNKSNSTMGLLKQTSIETVVHLGSRAFDAEAGLHDGVAVALFVIGNQTCGEMHRSHFIGLSHLPTPDQKKAALSSKNPADGNAFLVKQRSFLTVNESPLLYSLSEQFLTLLATSDALASIAPVRQGIAVGGGNTDRFIRFSWECTHTSVKAVDFANGGGYCKWFGNRYSSLLWRQNGTRIRLTGRSVFRNETFYGRPGLTYSLLSGGAIGTRELGPGEIFDGGSSPSLFPDAGNKAVVAALLSSRFASYVLRKTSQSIRFNEGYTSNVPVVPALLANSTLATNTRRAVDIKRTLTSLDPVQRHFAPQLLIKMSLDELLQLQTLLHAIEGTIESLVFAAYRLPGRDIAQIIFETGTPAAWHPRIAGYDAIPPLAADVSFSELAELTTQAVRDLSGGQITDLKRTLLGLITTGSVPHSENDSPHQVESEDDDDDAAPTVGLRIPIPTETFIEELSERLEVHPFSIYWLLHNGCELEAWRCSREERRLWSDRVTVTILRLLGHRWPKQIEAGEPVPDWADPDGIIPLTPLATESTLFERVQQRLRADEIDASDFAEVMDKPLDAWLATEFFKHHTKQFKKRPIAWQIQSNKFTARASPAFACLLYYHKLDADTLPKLRSQYVGPLRQRLETELRGIQGVAAEARSDRQEKRRAELEDAIHELTAFDAKLEHVAREGFAVPGLKKLLESEPLDRWCSLDGTRPHPTTTADLTAQESAYAPDINDGVRVNIAPLQKAGLLAADVLAKKDVDKAIADRAQWRADERRWVREGKLPQPGWWPENGE